MDQPVATVISVSDRDAVVRVAGSACPRCAAGQGCGAGIFGRSGRALRVRAEIPAGRTVRAGDQVVLALSGRHLLQAAWLVYGLPLAGLIFGAVLALMLASGSDGSSVALSLAGLVTGAATGRWLARRDRCVSELHPTIAGPAGDVEGGQ